MNMDALPCLVCLVLVSNNGNNALATATLDVVSSDWIRYIRCIPIQAAWHFCLVLGWTQWLVTHVHVANEFTVCDIDLHESWVTLVGSRQVSLYSLWVEMGILSPIDSPASLSYDYCLLGQPSVISCTISVILG